MKLELFFQSESDLTDVSDHIVEYKELWEKYGSRIISTLEAYSGFTFRETFINISISEFISFSHPFNLKTYPDIDNKLSAMTHELAHRVMFKQIKGMGKQNSLIKHKALFLFLYDAFAELYGEDFLHKTILFDSSLNNKDLEEAWGFVTKMTKNERAQLFERLKTEGAEILIS